MNFNIKLKTQNLRSFNLSTSLISMQKKVSATTHENDDIIFLTNTQVGTKRNIVEKEFLNCKNGPYLTYFNSDSASSAGVMIAIHIRLELKILEIKKDDENRILILKTLIGEEMVTLVSMITTLTLTRPSTKWKIY
jgi:hypothetical protein